MAHDRLALRFHDFTHPYRVFADGDGVGHGRVVLTGSLVKVDLAVIQREISALARRRTGGPVRTCVGCRKRELAVGLLRVVAVSTGSGKYAVIVDASGSLPGRGAWLHPVPQCAHEAIRRRAFVRALRITGSPDTSAVVEQVNSLAAPGNRTGSKNMSTP